MFLKEIPFASFTNAIDMKIERVLTGFLIGWTICPQNFRDIRKQIIWGNKYIKYNGKCLVKVNWIKSGIIFINDILDEYGHISEYKSILPN